MSYDLKNKDIAKLKLETNPSYYDGYTKAIVAKRNDVNSKYLHVDIYASGKEVDITKFSPSMNVETPSGEHFSTNGQVIDGELYFKIYDSLLKDVGHLSCDISLYRECTNVNLDTDGSIYYGDIKLTQNKFINQVENIGTYIFEYDGSDWKLEDDIVVIADYGIEMATNISPIAQDKIIISYSNYMLLTTETFFIAIQDNIYSDDAQIPTDEDGRVFDYIDAQDVLVAIEQSHIHDNKDILDATTASYTAEDKTKLKNINTNLYVEKAVMGAANGVATLDNSGLVPAGQLPSFVDDVIESYIVGVTEFANDWLSLTETGSALTPEKGKIYVIVSEGGYKNKQYRWGGSTYVLCNPSDVNSVNGKTGVVSINLDDIPNGETNVHTTNNFTDELKNKLDGIEDGAQVNVTPDWNATKEEKGYIANKPIIPEGSQLYDSTGENTDGSMTQKATTEAIENYPATVFAESERQKSKNLLQVRNGLSQTDCGMTVNIDDNDVITVGGTSTNPVAIKIATFYPKVEKGKSYTLSFYDYSNLSNFSIATTAYKDDTPTLYNVLNLTPEITTITKTFDDNYELKVEVYLDNSQKPTGSFKIMLEQSDTKSEKYQSYNGQISHTGDKEIEFAREEFNKSKNLFDKGAVSLNTEISGTSFKENSYYFTSDYCVVKGLDSVYLSGKTEGASNLFYDDNYNYIDKISAISGQISVPTGAAYMRFNAPTTQLDNEIMLEAGTESTEYQPYNGSIVHQNELSDYANLSKDNIFTGSNTFNGKFIYGAMEEATSNYSRNIWFNDNTTPGKPVSSGKFKYNPVTDVLTCGRLSGSADYFTGFSERKTTVDFGTLKDTSTYTYVAQMNTSNKGAMALAESDGKLYMQLDGTLFVNEGADEVATLSGTQTITGAKTFTSNITLTKSSPDISLINTGTDGDTVIKFTRKDTEKSCQFGIGSGGTNRGFWDITQNRWIIYCDDSKANLNSVTVPSGQTLTINGSIIV